VADQQQATSAREPEESAQEQEEVVDGVLVVADVRALELVPSPRPPFVQVAAVAATGFMAGAATAAVLGRRFSRSPSAARRSPPSALPEPRPPRPGGGVEVLSSQRFLVDVYTLARR
jgi:hypothetical protein